MTAATESPTVQSNPAGLKNDPSAQTGPRAQGQARARARDFTAKSATAGVEQVRRFTGTGMLDATPATVKQVWDYTRKGGWIPGDRAQWLEWIGKIYGYLIAVPLTAVLFIGLWFAQRPTRLALGVILWFAARWAL